MPTLVINPATDRDFVALANAYAQDAADTGALQALLRVKYPNSVVRLRALAGESTAVWYVYRDGRWVPPEK